LTLVILAFFAAGLTSNVLGKDPFVISDYWGYLQVPVLLALISWAAALGTQKELYEYRMRSFRQTLWQLVIATGKGGGLFLALLFLFGQMRIGRTTYLLQVAYTFSFLLVERAVFAAILHSLRKRGRNYQSVLVVGTGEIARSFVDDTFAHKEWGVRVVGFLDWVLPDALWRYRDIPLVGNVGEIGRIIQNSHVDYVVFAVPRSALSQIDASIHICEETGTPALLVADFFAPTIASRRITELAGKPVIVFSPTPDREPGILVKSAFDRLAAFVGLVIVAPIMFGAAVAIKLQDRGSVLFRQHRCGLNGRRFWLYKFRSMVTNAEELKAELMRHNEIDGAAFKMANDPRVTKVGRFLRKTSIDELPQLWNVLCGHMSLVGPRPPLPDEVSQFDRWQRRKLSMKPGITGLWQVGGRSNVQFEDWMRLDLQYIDQWSLRLDAKILLRTIPAVISGHGAK
jgi:exopolysaccharide biosynthesis polyprenyl glycosylphosphotransferase